MTHRAYNSEPTLHRSKGLALVELMIAMVLGLVLIGAAAGIMLSNTQSFRTTKSLSQIQNSARLGFELMARDIRQAGAIQCGNDISVNNLLSVKPWYLDWDGGSKGQLIGYSGAANIAGLTNRVNGTEALTILYADDASASLKSSSTQAYTIDNSKSHFKTDDIAFICDANNGSIFNSKVTTTPIDNEIIVTASVEKNEPSQSYLFEKNSVISKIKSRAWYIGNNEKGNRSLYLTELSGAALGDPIEIASGVESLTFRYRLTDTADFKVSSEISGGQWQRVNAIEVSFKLLGEDQNVSTDSGVDSGRITRSFTSIVALRNRIL